LSVPKSSIQNPSSRSNIRDPTSEIQHPESNIRKPTSGIQHPESNIRDPASEIQHPESNIRDPASEIQHPASGIQHPQSNIRNPASFVQHPKSNIRNPASEIQHPYSKSERSERSLIPHRTIPHPSPNDYLAAVTWNNLTKREQSLQLIRALRGLRNAKGKNTETDLARLRQVGRQQRLLPTEVQEILDSSDKADVIVPKSDEDKMEVLYYLVFRMKSDPTLEPDEIESIKYFGEPIGLREDLEEDFVKLVNKFKNTNVAPEDMIARMQKVLDTPEPEPEPEPEKK